MDEKPLILISNDDGYADKGIVQLTEMVCRAGAYAFVVAPDSGRSGTAMSFTGSLPIRLRKEKGYGTDICATVYSCSGTPCDCVKLAIGKLLPRRPDLILSGINHGDNAAINAHYSGTMAIALEGLMKGIPSIGFSSCKLSADADFSALEPTIVHFVKKTLLYGLQSGVCLNINFPDAESFKGIKMCRMGMGDWVNELECRTDPRGRTYYWVAGNYESHDGDDKMTDTWALNNGYIAVTPMQLDMTAYGAFDNLKNIMP